MTIVDKLYKGKYLPFCKYEINHQVEKWTRQKLQKARLSGTADYWT